MTNVLYKSLLFEAVILLTVQTALNADPCPNDWYYFKGRCFYTNSTSLEFNRNLETCRALGGSAVSIHSKEENDYLSEYVLSTDVYYCLGLRQRTFGTDDFAWADGSPVNYENWEGGRRPNLQTRCFSSEIRNKLWYGFSCSTNCRLFCQTQVDPKNETKSNHVIDEVISGQLKLERGQKVLEHKVNVLEQTVSSVNSKLTNVPSEAKIAEQIQTLKNEASQTVRKLETNVVNVRNELVQSLLSQKTDLVNEIQQMNTNALNAKRELHDLLQKKATEQMSSMESKLRVAAQNLNAIVRETTEKEQKLNQKVSDLETSVGSSNTFTRNLDANNRILNKTIQEIKIAFENAVSDQMQTVDSLRNSIAQVKHTLSLTENDIRETKNSVQVSLTGIEHAMRDNSTKMFTKLDENEQKLNTVLTKIRDLDFRSNSSGTNQTTFDTARFKRMIDAQLADMKKQFMNDQAELEKKVDRNTEKHVQASADATIIANTVKTLQRELSDASSHMNDLDHKTDISRDALASYNDKLQTLFSKMSDASSRQIKTSYELKELHLQVTAIQNKTLEALLQRIAGRGIVYKEQLEQEHYKTMYFNAAALIVCGVFCTFSIMLYIACRGRKQRQNEIERRQTYEVFETQLNNLLK